MNRRFPILSALSTLIRIAGLLLIIAGIYVAVARPGEPASDRRSDSEAEPFFVLYLAAGGVLAVAGVAAIIVGEAVGVLFAIEENTLRSANLLANTAKPAGGPPSPISHDY